MLDYNPTLTSDAYGIDQTPNASNTFTGQQRPFFWLKKAIIHARKEQFFMPLASTINMPKHFGKTITIYDYIPLLDDRNVNDQGLNAAGATLVAGTWTAYNAAGVLQGNAYANQALAVTAAGAGGTTVPNGGNLYGSSRDIGAITGRIPTLTEAGGRVNRVGFTRLTRSATISKFGFFTEFTKESIDFDSDEGLMDHLSRELVNGAVQLTEAVLQKDLLNAATVIIYAGGATSKAGSAGVSPGVAGEVVTISTVQFPPSIVSYKNLMRLDQLLTDNRTPRQTTVITGSRMIDTKTIPAARVLFCGNEVTPLLKGMTDLFGNKAFIPVQQYADAGTILNGEIGAIDNFRIVQVPEMLHWAGGGYGVTTNPGYRQTGNNYDVYPLLVLGEDSWTTVGFQTDGKTVKFSVMTKMPGRETATKDFDPYGESGFSSIKWYYGILIKRPERIGIIYTVAPM